MDTTQLPSLPPQLATTSPHSTGSNAAGLQTSTPALQQQQPQLQHQPPQQQAAPPQAAQPSAQQQAAINDFFRRYLWPKLPSIPGEYVELPQRTQYSGRVFRRESDV